MLRTQKRRFVAVLAAAVAGFFVASRGAAQVAGQNINMVSGTKWPGGDPFLQRQNEPSLAVSSRNPLHLLAGANDYRTVDLPTEPGSIPGTLSGDAWLGVFKSFDGGLSWQSTLLPGYPQDRSAVGMLSPLKAYSAAADPTVRAGASGLLYYSGIGFNRGTNIGAVFLSRLFDTDSKENGDATAGRDTIAYLDTTLLDTGTSGQFLDKPWLAVDVARSGSGATTCSFTPPGGTPQSFVGGNVYMTWSRFTGSSSTKIMFSRSLDCGRTWSNPIKLSESNSINQGTNIAVDPQTGIIYVVWRRFATSSQPDAILVSKSTDFGQTFSSKNTVQVATISPFDQSTATTGTRFRTNALPSIAVSVDASNVSRVHIAWAQRNTTNSDAQIVVATSADGLKWGAPAGVDTVALKDDGTGTFSRGHQFMPQLTFSQGRLMVLYYDQRLDHTLGLFTPNSPFAPDANGNFYKVFRDPKHVPPDADLEPVSVFGLTIDDLGLAFRRHTIDLRVAEALPSATPGFHSTSVSQYKIGLRSDLKDEEGNPIPLPITSLNQLQLNAPNLPLFAQGTVPFLGDYIDIAGPTIVPNGSGGWRFNTAAAPAPVFYATWTDNRDVVPPANGDWTSYTPPGSTLTGVPSVLDPTQTTQACNPGHEGMRNQNIYSSRITEGLLVGSPQNIKPLFAPPKSRAFIVTLQNLTAQDRTFTLTLAPGTGVVASFQQTAPTSVLTVTVAARSGAARPVFASYTATPPGPAGSVAVNVAETGPGSIGLSGFVILNPEGSVSPLAQPDGTTVDIGTVEIYTPTLSLWNPANPNPFLNIADPNISNPNISNPNISNADPAILNVADPNISNPNISNQEISNPDPAVLALNPNISNTTAANPNISNPNISNPNISNTTISDTTYAVTNSGNTTHSYRVALYGNNPTSTPLQLIVTKNYATPASVGCTLQTVPQGTVLANVNTAVFAPTLSAATDPNIPDSATTNATMALAPGETAFVTLRGALTPDQMAQLTRSLTPVVTAHGQNSNNTNDFAALLFIQTTSGTIPAAVVGVPYSFTFTSVGGTGTITWTSGGTLPTGLTLSSGGLLSGTPSGAGSFAFTVTATDGSNTPETATQSITMTVAARTSSTALTLAKNPIVVNESVSATVTVSDTQADGTKSFPSGIVTVGSGAVAGSCTLAPTATAGVSSCAAPLNAGAAGSYPLTASFSATTVHAGSSSPSVTLTVNPRSTTTAVTFAPNPVTILTPTTVTATVSDVALAGTASSPAGVVAFSSSVAGDTFSATTCAPSPATSATSACAATLTASTNAARTISAAYGGSTVHAASVSGASLTVKGNTTTAITSISPSQIVLGTPTTVSVTVAAVSPATGTPTGTVTVSAGSGGGCTITLTSGAGSCTWTPLAGGSTSLTGTYSGDVFFNGSSTTSAPVTVLVYYNFNGFLSPLSTAGTLASPTFSGTQNNGSAAPLKWQLRDSSGNFLTSITTTQLVQAVAYTGGSCSGQATGQTIVLYNPTNGATGGTTFRYDTTNNQFIFNWDTTSVFGVGCYELLLTLNDGSPIKATTVKLQ